MEIFLQRESLLFKMKDVNVDPEPSQVVFVSPATLEDRLLYDDVFVDYFNVFLHLKAFGTAIRYERLDGYYLDEPADKMSNSSDLQQLVDDEGKFLQQGAISLWIKEHRLPFFLRSHLFLEYKLCKLLLRKLSDTSRVQESRLELRGYSRLSTPLVLPDSPEQWSESPVDYASQASWPMKGPGQHYHRPLGSSSSLPAMLSVALETRLKLLEGPPKRASKSEDDCRVKTKDDSQTQLGDWKEDISNSENFAKRLKIRSASDKRMKHFRKRASLFTPSSGAKEGSKKGEMYVRRTRSAPVEGLDERVKKEERTGEIFSNDFFEIDEDDTILCFNEEDVEKAETELRSMIDENKRNLQDMKEDALNSSSGMRELREFLHGTSGLHLLTFWIDVEEYKDLDDQSNVENESALQMMRKKLFREINDKYKSHLTGEAKRKIRDALNHEGLTKDLFTRTQYDTLRRLRSYWIPRFLVHKEKTNDEVRCNSRVHSSLSDGRTTLSFLPKISFVHSLPPRGEWCTERARQSCDWSKNLTLSDVNVQSKKKRMNTNDETRDDYNEFLSGLSCEKDAGWPFRAFLERVDKKGELSNLLFWQSIEDLKTEESRGCDRHLHLCNAWSIVKCFLSNELNEPAVNMSELEKQKIIERLRQCMEVSSSLFTSGQAHALEVLRTAWDEYLKNERLTLKKSVKSSIGKQSTVSKIDSKHGSLYQNIFFPGKWYPRYPESSPSERQRRLHTAMTIAENIETTRMSMHSARKSPATAPVKKRSRMKSRTSDKPESKEKVVKFKAKKEKPKVPKKRPDSSEEEDEREKVEEKPLPAFRDFLNDKSVISSFKQYVQNTEGSHAMNGLALYLDVETYNAIASSNTSQRTERASQIFRDYYDPSSRKCVDLPTRIPFKIKEDRPSTPVLTETQDYLLPEIETSFRQFLKSQRLSKPAAAHEAYHPVTAGKNETPFSSNSFAVYYKRKRNKFKGPGRLQPSKDDKVNFVNELRETYGVLSPRLELFRRYLDNNDDVQGEGVSKLENDLLFYLEVQKFKDLFLYMDDTTLLKKVDAIVDCFLDSATPPSVQIDISSDLAGRTVHKVQSLHTRSKLSRDQRDCAIFDDAQNNVLKELLPFWAGFTRQHDSQSAEQETERLPPTRRQMIVKRRYSAFKKFPLKKRPVSLRSVLPNIGESKRELNYSLGEGLAWKENLSEYSGSVYSVNVRSSTRTGRHSQASRVV